MTTIVMYHYIRALAQTRYPSIRARTISEFRRQLDHLQERYTIITAERLIDCLRNRAELPEDAALLTFDDGYLEHFNVAFPLLYERNLQGVFFPPARAVLHRKLLDVNKIHFTLAAAPGANALVDFIKFWIKENGAKLSTEEFSQYWDRYAKPGRYDPPEIVFIKRLLQKGLPGAAREELCDALFRRFVDVPEKVFAEELYMTADQLRLMQRCGMHVGSHGDEHIWLDTISRPEQEGQIESSLEFLEEIGAKTDDWIMCYPYGAWNEGLLHVLQQRGCALGLTTRSAVADIANDPPLLLPRIDTNDLPH